jgi:hypothetical protein
MNIHLNAVGYREAKLDSQPTIAGSRDRANRRFIERSINQRLDCMGSLAESKVVARGYQRAFSCERFGCVFPALLVFVIFSARCVNRTD